MKNLLNKKITYESMEKFIDLLEVFLMRALIIIGFILVIVNVLRI